MIVCIFSANAAPAADREWSSVVPSEQRPALARRLHAYLKANRARDWRKLYDLISDVARGGTDRQMFIQKMMVAHGRNFANAPDLLEFEPARTVNESGLDIVGCAKAQREGRNFNGIALIHAVFDRNQWFFSGWRFTAFPNEPCKALSDPSWEMPGPMEWNQPMEELRGAPSASRSTSTRPRDDIRNLLTSPRMPHVPEGIANQSPDPPL